MTYEETLKRIEIQKKAVDGYLPKLIYENVKEALEKQIPMKPVENEPMWAICPNCGGSISKDNVLEYIIYGETSFCEHCGQAIDWSDYEKD